MKYETAINKDLGRFIYLKSNIEGRLCHMSIQEENVLVYIVLTYI